MDILFLLVPLSVVLAVFIGWSFWRAVDTGQFDDLDGPALHVIADDDAGTVANSAGFDVDQARPGTRR
jgi:cbb3-type cytochrome oxidase maturation protein